MGVTEQDLEDTLLRAGELVSNYRGKIAKRDKKISLITLAASGAYLLIAVIVGMLTGSYVWVGFLVILFLIALYIVHAYFKSRCSLEYRMSHFLLAVFCRAENNRLYLRHGIEMRPGFNGQWLEFGALDLANTDEIISMMRQRFLKPSLEQKAALFEREITGRSDLVNQQQSIESEIRGERERRRQLLE